MERDEDGEFEQGSDFFAVLPLFTAFVGLVNRQQRRQKRSAEIATSSLMRVAGNTGYY
jgi:hypothetical protein